MTIAISIKVNDGIVLAADSASTLIQTDQEISRSSVINVYDNADKVFKLFKALPIGAVTWGAGSIGKESISTLVKDFRRVNEFYSETTASEFTVKKVAEKFGNFFWEKYKTTYGKIENPPELGFIIAGYSPGEALAEEYKIEINGREEVKPVPIRPINDSGAAWFGQPEAIYRLIKGYSGHLPELLGGMGVRQEDINIIVQECQKYIEAPHIHDAMPIKDAIDLAKFLVEVTIGFVRFNPGAKTVGGPIDLAAITKHEGFKWVKRKYHYDRDMNSD